MGQQLSTVSSSLSAPIIEPAQQLSQNERYMKGLDRLPDEFPCRLDWEHMKVCQHAAKWDRKNGGLMGKEGGGLDGVTILSPGVGESWHGPFRDGILNVNFRRDERVENPHWTPLWFVLAVVVLLLVLGAVCVISGRRYTRKKKNTPLFHEGEKGSGQTGGTRTGVDNEEDWSDIELGDSMVGRY